MAGESHSNEVAFTEFVAQNLWHRIRVLPTFSKHLSLRCKQCILPETYAPLNSEGLCPHCVEFNKDPNRFAAPPISAADHDRLDSLLRDASGKGAGTIDAVVLFSGGKDSSYMVNRLSRDYPNLRLLTLLIDNGFMSPHAMRNAKEVLEHFDLPHITHRLKPSFVKKVFHHALTHLDEQTSYSIVDLMDAKLSFDTGKNMAMAFGAPLVICGLARVQTEILYEPLTVELPFESETKQLPKYTGMDLRSVYDEEEMKFWYDHERTPAEKRPRFLLPFTVWDPSEDEVLKEVTSMGLLTKKRSRPLVTNNALIPVIAMAECARFGYCSWEVEFGRMVREGKSERQYWLNIFEMNEYATKTGNFVNKTVIETLAKLALTKKDIGIES